MKNFKSNFIFFHELSETSLSNGKVEYEGKKILNSP